MKTNAEYQAIHRAKLKTRIEELEAENVTLRDQLALVRPEHPLAKLIAGAPEKNLTVWDTQAVLLGNEEEDKALVVGLTPEGKVSTWKL